MDTTMKNCISREIKDKLHQAICRQEFLTMAITGLTERAEEIYDKNFWFGGYLVMWDNCKDLRAIQKMIENEGAANEQR